MKLVSKLWCTVDRPSPSCIARRSLAANLRDSLWFALAVLAAFLVCLAAGQLLIFPPLVGSAVVVFGAPASEMARWKAVIGGHLLSAVVGLACVRYASPDRLGYAIVVGSAIAFFLMLITDTVHSPAGANPAAMTSIGSAPQTMLGPLLIALLTILLIARLARVTRNPRPVPHVPDPLGRNGALLSDQSRAKRRRVYQPRP